jgi:hypothetical protein
MTPSINRLAESANILGKKLLDDSFMEVLNLFNGSRTTDLESFREWVRDYTYYHALVCVCEGVLGDIDAQLAEDYQELLDPNA